MITLGRPVAVGITGGPSDYALALEYAAAAARRRGVGVRVVHGCEPFHRLPRLEDPEADQRNLRQGHQQARIAARRLRDLLPAGREVSVSTPPGSGPEALVEESAQACLVVLQRRDLSALGRISAGSTTSAVAAQAACPVVAVRPGAVGGAGGVVVGVDAAGHAEAALAAAFAEADALDCGIVAVHAWQWQDTAFQLGYAPTDPDEIDQAERTHRERLAELVAPYADRHPTVPVELSVVAGPVPSALVGAAAGARLLVVSRHKPAAKPRGLGSIARRCLNEAPCPVMVVAGSRPTPRPIDDPVRAAVE